jgi:hypothetical protein
MPYDITSVITVVGGLVAAGTAYVFTKWREREAEWRREKRDHYKAFVAAISGITEGESTPSSQREFARACNNLNLVAPQRVIEAMREFREEISPRNAKKSQDRHDKLLSRLLYEMRGDLRISPRDDSRTFMVQVYSSGHPPQNRDDVESG